MKKIKIIIIILLAFLLVGCVVNEKPSDTGKTDDNQKPSDTEKGDDEVMNKSIVLYFSCTGTTKTVATKIKEYLNCDILEIEPVIPYTSSDLNYNNSNSRANIESNDDNARPEFKELNLKLEDYYNIFIGYPIWWGTMPKIIFTLLDKYDFGNKNIIPFCTSGGSGISSSINDIKRLEPNANVMEGKRLSSSVSQSDLSSWIDSLNIIQDNKTMNIYVNNTKLEVELILSDSTSKLIEKLKDGDLNIQVSDYGNFEKVGNLGFSLPRNDEEITVKSNDVVLYQGDKICIYYNNNSWSFTRIGKITNVSPDELKDILTGENLNIRISLN